MCIRICEDIWSIEFPRDQQCDDILGSLAIGIVKCCSHISSCTGIIDETKNPVMVAAKVPSRINFNGSAE